MPPIKDFATQVHERWHDLAASVRGRLSAVTAKSDTHRPEAGSNAQSLATATQGWRQAGWALAGLAVGGGVLWAATARLDGAAIAPGVVTVETNRKSIQHLEGGIVGRILVAEGDHVAAGQDLVLFDDTYPRATLQLLRGQQAAAEALRARLMAERDGHDAIDFPDSLIARAGDPEVAQAIVVQVDAFEARRAALDDEVAVLSARVGKWRGEAAGLARQRDAARRRLDILREELANNEEGLAKGVVARNQVLALRQDMERQQEAIAELDTDIATARDAAREAAAQKRLPTARRDYQLAEQIQSVQSRLTELKEKVMAAEDVLRRTRVTAPRDGRVVDLRVHTEGGVVQPGERLMDLVPDSDRLVVEVRVHPRDRDVVHPGMPARVRVTAFNARETAPLDGTVLSVSADRLVDDASGTEYFAARVVPDDPAGDARERPDIVAGMQAEVFLVTGERTVLDYLLEPLRHSLDRAGRET